MAVQNTDVTHAYNAALYKDITPKKALHHHDCLSHRHLSPQKISIANFLIFVLRNAFLYCDGVIQQLLFRNSSEDLPMDNEHTQYLIVPGWHGSEADHWQSHWHQTLPGAHRVEQRDWVEPQLHDWVQALDQKIHALSGKQIILVAHSLGCVTVAHWARTAGADVLRRIGGALLVAPADVERDNATLVLRNFGPVPLEHLPFPSVLVGSTNDTAASAERVILFGRAWGAKIAMLTNAGHINVRSGHTKWEAGFRHLYQLQQLISARTSTTPRPVRRPLLAPSVLLSPSLLLPRSARHVRNNDHLRVAL